MLLEKLAKLKSEINSNEVAVYTEDGKEGYVVRIYSIS